MGNGAAGPWTLDSCGKTCSRHLFLLIPVVHRHTHTKNLYYAIIQQAIIGRRDERAANFRASLPREFDIFVIIGPAVGYGRLEIISDADETFILNK